MAAPVIPADRYHALVRTLARLLELRHPVDAEHGSQVTRLCQRLARRLQLTEDASRLLADAAELHSLGCLLQVEEKKGLGAFPLTEPGLLGGRHEGILEREEAILRSVLEPNPRLAACLPLLRERHQRNDGADEPTGRRPSREAAILAVVDAFVDLRLPRVAPTPLSAEAAIAQLRQEAPGRFDPAVVDALADEVTEDERQWRASSAALQSPLSRHWLERAHVHRRHGEPGWALRCYLEARRVAESGSDRSGLVQATMGAVMVHLEAGHSELACCLLEDAETKLDGADASSRAWLQLLWGAVRCHRGAVQEGRPLMEEAAQAFLALQDLRGLAVCRLLLARLDAARWLEPLMALLSHHDFLDLLEQMRPEALSPLGLAARSGPHQALAGQLLARLGAPMPEATVVPETHPEPVVRASDRPTLVPVSAGLVRPTLEVSFLGPITLRGGRVRVDESAFPTRKSLRLLALLLFRRNTWVSDEELMAMLWPESEASRSRASLRNALHQVRVALSPLRDAGVFIHLARNRRVGTISLQVEATFDMDTFEHGVDEAGTLAAEGRMDAARESLRNALAAWHGDFLSSLREDEWAEDARTHYAEVYLRALQMGAQAALEAGEADEAEWLARQALTRDDLREPLHVLLIRALQLQGRRRDAVAHYLQALELFARELGLDEPAELKAVDPRLVA